MGTHRTEDVERLARIFFPSYDNEHEAYKASLRATACRGLDAGVTLPPEPPKWWTPEGVAASNICFGASSVARLVTWCDGVGDPDLARRLADHLNATDFEPNQ